MESAKENQSIVFESVWNRQDASLDAQVRTIWKEHGGPVDSAADDRLMQLVFVARRTDNGQVVGISTAFKVYVKKLRNQFFAIRLMLVPEARIPGLTSKLLVLTRDFLESMSQGDVADPAIGIITLVENERLKHNRNEAIWPASGMVYIGNSKEGHHIRVYYFSGARILP